MSDQASKPNVGAVVAVRGSVVDVRFDARLPPIYSVLRAGDRGRIVIEVLAQRDAHHVRGIALTPTEGLARGMAVEDTGGPLKAPVGNAVLSRMFDVFGDVIDRGAPLSDVAVALGASSAAAAGATLHQVRGLRDRHQGHRRARAARARRQGRPLRRRGRGQDGAAHRDDPQHDRAPRGREHLLWHRRALSRGRGALPRHEGGRRAAEHGDGLRPDERAAGQPVPGRARGADDGRVLPRRRAPRRAAAHRQHLSLHPGRHGGLRA